MINIRTQKFITNEQLKGSKMDILEEMKNDISIEMGLYMMKEKLITFEEEPFMRIGSFKNNALMLTGQAYIMRAEELKKIKLIIDSIRLRVDVRELETLIFGYPL